MLNLAEFVDQINNAIFTSSKDNQTLTGHVIASDTSVGSSLQCMQYCANMANGKCESFNHNDMTGECQLNNKTGRQDIDDFKTREGYKHYYFSKSDMIMLPKRP